MSLALNNLKPAKKSKTTKKRLGRGVGSGWGKTAGRGHKGQHARKGGYHKVGFEGGQTPLQRSIRKSGFRSTTSDFNQEIRMDQLVSFTDQVIDLAFLKAKNLCSHRIKRVKVIASGKLSQAIKLKGLKVTAGARRQIESLGGSIEE